MIRRILCILFRLASASSGPVARGGFLLRLRHFLCLSSVSSDGGDVDEGMIHKLLFSQMLLAAFFTKIAIITSPRILPTSAAAATVTGWGEALDTADDCSVTRGSGRGRSWSRGWCTVNAPTNAGRIQTDDIGFFIFICLLNLSCVDLVSICSALLALFEFFV